MLRVEMHFGMFIQVPDIVATEVLGCGQHSDDNKGHAVSGSLGVLTSVLHPLQRFPPRTVVHFSYHAWPDHGVPRTALPLRRLAASARDIPSQGPPVVHCSAGTRCAAPAVL